MALTIIGFMTALVGDLAKMFGCVINLEDSVTAITFVALGTSLPDTFASRSAALNDKYADAAIGNVTGSNSVNVFLGLGTPWLLAAIVNSIRGEPFIVCAGDLSFSVTIFTVCAIICIGTLILRRYTVGGELGGSTGTKWATFVLFVVLWLVYVMLSALKTYKKI